MCEPLQAQSVPNTEDKHHTGRGTSVIGGTCCSRYRRAAPEK